MIIHVIHTITRKMLDVNDFSRAKYSVARLCHDMLSVCPSVCPSVSLSVRPSMTLVDCNHTRWNSSKIIMISLNFLLSADPNIASLLQREHPKILAGIGVEYIGKIVDFRHLSCSISETVQDRVQVAIDH